MWWRNLQVIQQEHKFNRVSLLVFIDSTPYHFFKCTTEIFDHNGKTHVLTVESISIKVTNEVSLYNNWQLLAICISFGVLSVVPHHETLTLSDITVLLQTKQMKSLPPPSKFIFNLFKLTERFSQLTVDPVTEFLPFEDIMKTTVAEYIQGEGFTMLLGLLYHVDRNLCNHLS